MSKYRDYCPSCRQTIKCPAKGEKSVTCSNCGTGIPIDALKLDPVYRYSKRDTRVQRGVSDLQYTGSSN